MKKFQFIFLVFTSLLIQSCNKIDDPYIPLTTKEWYGKRALIEDYTGHFCPNCPDAAVEVAKIDSTHGGDKVIIIAVHCSEYYSRPQTQFPEDFRTETGNTWYDFFGISGLPTGMINRINYPLNKHKFEDKKEWASNVSNVLSQIPEVDIDIKISFDSITKKVTGKATTKFLKTIKKKLQLQLILTEDSIIAPQQNHSIYDPNYVHRHMLRDAINGSWGSLLTNGVSENLINSEISYPFVYTLKQSFPQNTPAINWRHASVIAFVYDADTYEILQVAEKHIE